MVQAGVQELLATLKDKYELILTIGSEAMHRLANTKRTLDQYAGSLTWNKFLNAWVLPSYHPSVIYVGDKKTINARYEKFDHLYLQIQKAARLLKRVDNYPPVKGFDIPMEHIGHDGTQLNNNLWSGYEECTEEEVLRAITILQSWLLVLDS